MIRNNFSIARFGRRFVAALIILVAHFSIWAQDVESRSFNNETLNYQIVYHWGIIWKHAASATLNISSVGDKYHSSLCARTISWADKIYRVRDTLTSVIDKDELVPIRYVKSSHEGKDVGRDVVNFTRSEGNTHGQCIVYRPKTSPRTASLNVKGKAYDMLSVFYMLRSLNYETFSKTRVYTSTIFSGRKQERLNIKYVGIENVKLRDKSVHNAYHIKFSFTQDGRTKSSDDIDTWISTDSLRIPLMMLGKLPIGEVRCYYAR